MNIYVLLKKTLDTEDKIGVSDGQIEEDSEESIINPYDEEAVVQRDERGGNVTVVTIRREDSEIQLRTALSMRADDAVLINTEDDIDEGDQVTTVKILQSVLGDREVDLILAVNLAIDESS